MKKLIALVSVFSIMAVAGMASAGNMWTSVGSDDFIGSQTSRVNRTFTVNSSKYANLDNNLTINNNSGGNFIAAGGDIEGGDIVGGDANVFAIETSEVNSLSVEYTATADNGSDNNTVDSTGDNDFILAQDDVLTDDETITENSAVDDITNTTVNNNTGGNFAAAGEDVGAGFGISSGTADVQYDRLLIRGRTTILRN